MADNKILCYLKDNCLSYSERVSTANTTEVVIENELELTVTGSETTGIRGNDNRIQIIIPVTPDGEGGVVSAEYAEKISAAAVSEDYSAVKTKDVDGNVVITLSPIPVKSESVKIILKSIVTFGTAPGSSMTHLIIKGEEEEIIPLFKKYSDFCICSFQTDKAEVGIGDKIHVSWITRGADACEIFPYNRTVETAGSIDICIYEDTELFLHIRHGDYNMFQSIPITIQKTDENDIIITKNPDTVVSYGTDMIFQCRYKGSGHAYLSNGIGRIEKSQSIEGTDKVWKPFTSYDTYILRCVCKTDKGVMVKKAEVRAGMKDVLTIRYVQLEYSSEENKYLLSWDIRNAQQVTFKVGDKTLECHECSGDYIFQTVTPKTETVVQLNCIGSHNQVIDRNIRVMNV